VTTDFAVPPVVPAPTGTPARRATRLPGWLKGNLLLLPTTLWLSILLVVPMVIVVG
jgi:hypothetical protein